MARKHEADFEIHEVENLEHSKNACVRPSVSGGSVDSLIHNRRHHNGHGCKVPQRSTPSAPFSRSSFIVQVSPPWHPLPPSLP
eukprot:1919030-Rhodomonas_salina.2